jgi:hypothetical protein
MIEVEDDKKWPAMTAPGRPRGRSGADAVLQAALAAGSTAINAAVSTGVSERTVRRRLADPEFVEGIDRARAEVMASALARISSATAEAANTLIDLMASKSPPSVRLGAAKATIEYGIRLRAEHELSERLFSIEYHLGIREENL